MLLNYLMKQLMFEAARSEPSFQEFIDLPYQIYNG